MATKTNRSFLTWALWIAQALLALQFLMSGVSKLLSPVDLLGDQFAPLSGAFMRFIGAIEVLGSIGLILPTFLRILPFLTPLAAACLLIDMVAATIFTLIYVEPSMVVFPLVAAVLCAFVAYGRWRVVPLGRRMHPTPPLAGT
jgi:uncharacterized membrane protein YphA (DoxX/SURF4 family)